MDSLDADTNDHLFQHKLSFLSNEESTPQEKKKEK
jgi:hypothetical protein